MGLEGGTRNPSAQFTGSMLPKYKVPTLAMATLRNISGHGNSIINSINYYYSIWNGFGLCQ